MPYASFQVFFTFVCVIGVRGWSQEFHLYFWFDSKAELNSTFQVFLAFQRIIYIWCRSKKLRFLSLLLIQSCVEFHLSDSLPPFLHCKHLEQEHQIFSDLFHAPQLFLLVQFLFLKRKIRIF